MGFVRPESFQGLQTARIISKMITYALFSWDVVTEYPSQEISLIISVVHHNGSYDDDLQKR